MLKILHTSDWHLGQKFLFYDRQQEHQMALDWLAELIIEVKADVLIVAGDIFDIGNPPNYARTMYYHFLKKLLNTSCRHIIIIGGNHDSPAMLHAPKTLLEVLNVHVIGSASENIEDEILELKDTQGQLECIIAAVPFLRDRDLRVSVTGESGLERIERIKEGIRHHYEKIGVAVQKYATLNLPLIATGHLYATGAEAAEKQDNIYIGNTENIEARQFPDVFDYVALGHIHRAQAVGGIGKVRYSGSLIPLSFSEIKDDKSVYVVEFKGKQIHRFQAHPVPLFRRLKTIEGTLEEVQESLEKLAQKYNDQLPSWVEILVETNKIIPNLDTFLKTFTADMPLELLKIRTTKSHHSLDAQVDAEELHDLQPLDVFQKKCESAGSPLEEQTELVHTFRELQEWMHEEKG